MIPRLLHGTCISGGKCTKFCTSIKRVVNSTGDKCGWSLHGKCEHTIIGVIDSPNVSAREAICRGRLLFVGPVARSNEEKKLQYSSNIIDSVIVLDDVSSDRSLLWMIYQNSHNLEL